MPPVSSWSCRSNRSYSLSARESALRRGWARAARRSPLMRERGTRVDAPIARWTGAAFPFLDAAATRSAAAAASSMRPMTASPKGVRATPCADLSNNGWPMKPSILRTAADTDGCVRPHSRAAPENDPQRWTAAAQRKPSSDKRSFIPISIGRRGRGA